MEEAGGLDALSDLLEEFSRAQFRAKDPSPKVESIEKRCLELFGKDYCFSIIQNPNGELCSHYPRQIVFMEYESMDEDKSMFESTVHVSKLQDLVNRSKMARCRGRFVCPVILYKGKHICRSATLAGWGELYGRTGYNYIFSGGSDDAWADSEVAEEEDDAAAVRNGDSQLFDKVRGHDIKLLRYLSVKYICDLMVENKKVKFGLNVTSSEKVDKAQRYADFTLLSIPYPGCEFFKDYKDRNYSAEGLVFNWKQDFVDAPLNIPYALTRNLNIDWREYQNWDLVKQTQNYLKLLIHIINSEDNGLLVHCISGWDRTPLFISLLRLSLWADGMVHSNLKPSEILYLTVAYDWFLFGHLLVDRLSKGEEIFFFCFNFLKHITSDEFSSAGRKVRRKSSREPALSLEDFCLLKHRDRGSTTSLSSDFSVITEDLPGSAGHSNAETVDCMTAGAQSQAVWKRTHISSPQTVLWSRLPYSTEERMLQPSLPEAKSSSSSSSNHSDHFHRAGSSPLEVPQRRPPPQTERATRLEALRSIFLSVYNTTISQKISSQSPSGAIGGLLEQFARGVGLRGPSTIV
uniref:Myotubularin related protein 14 n=1 Tax=Leptobrachium leishanense TaxID=445787 RepID=A0A8C5WE92_9ANUR